MQQISSLSASRPDVDARGGLSGVESNYTPPAASGPDLFPRSRIESKERFCIQLQTAGHVVGANAGLVPRKVQVGLPNAAPKLLFPSTAVRANRVESQSDGTPPHTQEQHTLVQSGQVRHSNGPPQQGGRAAVLPGSLLASFLRPLCCTYPSFGLTLFFFQSRRSGSEL